MKLTGAQILMKVLKEEGADTIFGYPGGAVIDIYDELVKTDIRHILVRHEQGAVHAADGYARASGKVGVCLVTSGPGATNTVTGIASAYMDSIPLVVITGQVPSHLIGNDAFQEVDIVGITRPCTKHNYLVQSVEELAQVIKEAFYIARSGRPGPVLVDLPKDVINSVTQYHAPKKVKLRSYNPTYNPNMKQLHKVIELVKMARRPMIFAGGGVILAKAHKELTEFARRAQIPVTTSLMGLGAFPATDPLWLGMIGMHGTYRSNKCTAACDLLIAVGVRFDDRVTGKTDTFAAQAQIVHIDIDPTSIRKNIPVSIPVVGDCKITLGHINHLLNDEELGNLSEKRSGWFAQIAGWKAKTQLAYEQGPDIIKPQFVIEELYRLTEGKAIVTTEVGQNQMWAAQYYHFNEPGHFITSGGLGVMGFGLPAAIGAQVACPDELVVDVAGDGSIQMNIQEMATAVQYGLPVKIVILNNGYLGMVRQWQELFYNKCYACTCMEHAPDFVKLAEAYGAVGLRATRPDEVEKVLFQGLSVKKPVIMDFVVEKEESVYPMVPAGKPITEMLLV
ncbi:MULTISPECIES: biosynthetic-type acetolactate synthase large subunit [Desulfococcus]|jgi:acetolactate synthase-1/2/3 large subunit|uniref:Acetolactate synthase n=1 Tax=Desulfococcus multivorans DSM 2059 TaxID=1121405 RepID=S7U5Y7_DESML|nr:biosynthetic-type acetolactate synthase large subunit [Desulfococcus multivorans]AOY59122.1 IlvI: acetolactate synthase, large subunit [Desulfococcus multivorans]AQV01357.1 acetolactate synthase, large subunit, biosynthetic type [Desulfococcus multivorans]EPR44931.1 acetolactate synthase, large subunit, biosynthetic type [Desulfococcus multivorans DSM 2059]MDX9818832.1 biosynthetic-type acetolactate synthase large subunit [Desulfococcus multivorans]SJZ83694.1 acetolactate synthase, large su